MKVLVLGCGLVGTELARGLVADGHHVIGTTTTPGKVEALQEVCSDVAVLVGSDVEAVRSASHGCDVVAVCAGPNAQKAMSVEERAITYRSILLDTARAVVEAVEPTTKVIALSSLSVYGDAADHLDLVDENAPVTSSQDPSPSNFLAMERTYVGALAERALVYRCADIFGAGDLPIEDKVAGAHQWLSGAVPFRSEALFYRVHVDDVVRAIRHGIDTALSGIVNLTHEGVPVTNGELFDGISAKLGKPALTYRDEIKAPARPISVAKLTGSGFALQHTPVAAL